MTRADQPLVVCAPDSFKETMQAVDVATAMARGVRAAGAIAEICPIGDGGEGTMDALVAALGGRFASASVLDPLGRPLPARYGLVDEACLAIVELAEASGLGLLSRSERDPTRTTTYGTGQLIRRAVEWGARTIILCIGGSATCDGGAGLAQALGARFYDSQGLLIGEPVSGGALVRVARVEPPGALPPIRVACDVTNPLLGREGAARVFGPQKGALTEDVELLDRGLAHLAALLRVDSTFAGAGAAGGAGFGLAVLCGARLERGIELVLDAVHFRERSQGTRLVLTGEGRLDGQTMRGKAVMGVAAVAHEIGVPVVAIVGSTGPGAEACTDPSRDGLLTGYVSLTERYGTERAMRDTALLVEDVARRVVGSWG